MALVLTELAEGVSSDGGGSGYGTAAYTQSVTTSDNTLLLVCVTGLTNNANDVTGLTISGGSLTYTRWLLNARAEAFGTFVAWYTAPVTTGSTFNISVDATDSIYQWGVWAASVTGHHYRPVGATGTAGANASANAVTVTLDRTVRSGSIVLSGMAQDATTGAGAVTEGSGWAQLFENVTGVVHHVMSDDSSPDNTVEYTDISAGGSVFSYAIASIELVAAQTDPSVADWATSAISASRSPSVTFLVPAATNDIVIFWPSSTSTATITIPANWVNALGGTTDVESDAHEICCVYHVVTSGEAGTTTWTTTNLYDASETGNVVAALVRGGDTSTVLDSANSTFDSANAATPHVLASLTGANLSTGSLVLSAVAADSTLTYTEPANWIFLQTSNTNQGKALLERTAKTTSGVDVAATNITPSAGDEYASITVAVLSGGPAAVTGTVAVTLENHSPTASGTVANPVTGTSAVTLAAHTSAVTAVETFTGTSAQTLANATSTASGTVANPVTGTSAQTLADVTSTASGAETFTGTSATTLEDVTSSATATETFTGTVAVTLTDATSTASGIVANPVTGTSAQTLADFTSDATGAETITGTVAVTLADASSTVAGLVAQAVTGTSATTLEDFTSDATGDAGSAPAVTGSAAVTLADHTSTASGLETISGTSAVTLAGATSSATATETISGTVAVTLEAATSTATGAETITGTSSTTLANHTATATGVLGITGTVAVTLEPFICAATDLVNLPGGVTQTMRTRWAITQSMALTIGLLVSMQPPTEQTATSANITQSMAVTVGLEHAMEPV